HKAFTEKSAVLDLERARLSGMREPFWQTDTSVSFSSWGYVTNHKYKDVGLIVTEFVDIVSKNGCLLLNIGPKADGTIPEEEAEMLREIGGWLKVNGEAIYGSRPWKSFGEGPTETVEGHLSEQRNKRLTAEDIRYTTKGDQLYAIALGWPTNEWRMKLLGSGSEHLAGKKVASVELLGASGDVDWKQGADALLVQRPAEAPNEYAYVFRVGLE
ncbi:MAG: alpha-L-fucosidase, partial [bacterium]|nr:alpha-L-fucosidase [bacterium]